MRSDFTPRDEFRHLLAALSVPNRLALETSLATGLRISDVLNLKSADLKPRFTVRELKTGKNLKVYIPNSLLVRLKALSGKIYVFENRLSYLRPRTRQAVYKDLKRVCKIFRIKNLQLSPHSARKIFAVSEFRKHKNLDRVKQLLNHSSEAITILYAMADNLTSSTLSLSSGDQSH
uniref:Tyr recombinase domain-containing protein n=1 Tax=uncultured prokaryote TaxID=198431 RepID=A0A0H5PWH6_9ZZZZ|nr:unnamed protein product [uncultured bacterium]CRY93928.1 hypothetical protein [uncultured prokaryote]